MFSTIIFEDRKFQDINPVCIGHQDCEPCHSYGPAIRVNYLIHCVLKGEGVLNAPNGDFRVKQGQIFLIKPGDVNTYEADEKNPWEYIWVEFNGKIAEKLKEIDCPVIDCDTSIFLNLWNIRNIEEFKEEYAVSYLFSLIPALLRKEDKKDITGKIKNYINSNYMLDVNVENLSCNMGYTRQHISRVFKKDMGMSVQQYLIKTRLENAQKMLLKGFSVYETAFMCGYNDAFNFSKSFKSMYNISPKQWQKEKGKS